MKRPKIEKIELDYQEIDNCIAWLDLYWEDREDSSFPNPNGLSIAKNNIKEYTNQLEAYCDQLEKEIEDACNAEDFAKRQVNELRKEKAKLIDGIRFILENDVSVYDALYKLLEKTV